MTNFPKISSDTDRQKLIQYFQEMMKDIVELDSIENEHWYSKRNTANCGMWQMLGDFIDQLKYQGCLSPKYIRNSVTGKIYPIRKSSSKFDGDFFEKPD